MKKFILMVLFIFIFSFSHATENPLGYIGASAGYTKTSLNYKIGATETKISDSSGLYSFNTGIWWDSTRIEFMYQKRNELNASLNYMGYPLSAKMNTNLYMLNFFLEVPEISKHFIPYMGMGIGRAKSNAEAKILSISATDSSSSVVIASYLGFSVKYFENFILDVGVDLYTFKAFENTIDNISPHLGVRFLFNTFK